MLRSVLKFELKQNNGAKSMLGKSDSHVTQVSQLVLGGHL